MGFDTRRLKRFIFVHNYGGPKGGQLSWKDLNQLDIERAFNIKFDNKILEKIA